MSFLTTTLHDLMRLEDMRASHLERSSGVDRTTISRFLSGERVPNAEQVAALAVGISGDRDRRLALLLAYLRDEAKHFVRAGIDERHLVIAAADDVVAGDTGSLGAELALLADEATQSEELREMVSNLAALILRHRAALADKVAPFPGPVAAVADDPAPYLPAPAAPLPPVPQPGNTG